MKEVVKMKENIFAEPVGTMPLVGAMQQMQASPNISPAQTVPNVSPVQTIPGGNVSPVQTLPETMPAQPNPAAVMPSAMKQMPMMNQMPNMVQMPMMCCPYLMNMQCPMTYGQNVMGMNMMNNMMYPAVSPASGGMGYIPGTSNPVLGAAEKTMNAYPGMGTMPGMGTLPAMDNRYHYQY